MKRTTTIALSVLVLASRVSASDGATPIWEPTTITQPGRYVLTRDITATSGNAIRIQAGPVVLDLNGFTATGAAGQRVIDVNFTAHRVTIQNGRVTGGSQGVNFSANAGDRMRIEDVEISDTTDHGIAAGGTGGYLEILNCRVSNAGNAGISVFSNAGTTLKARIVDNVVLDAAVYGIAAQGLSGGEIRHNQIIGYSRSCPFFNCPGLLFSNSDAQSNVIEGNIINGMGNPASRGISFAQADSGRNLLMNNHVSRNAERGIDIESRGNRLSGNQVSNNGGEGVYVTSSFNVVAGNQMESNGRSLQFTASAQGNVYRDNVLRGNTNGVLDQGVNNTDAGGNVP